MKKSFYLLGVLVLGMFSCKKQESILENNKEIYTEFVNEHTSQNSLDWNGTYEGVLPCADCEGIKTTIILNSDGTFSSEEEYQKESILIVENKGKFTWDNSGLVVSLEGEGNEFKRYFKVVEGAIIHLDNGGNEITGGLAELYRLAKQ